MCVCVCASGEAMWWGVVQSDVWGDEDRLKRSVLQRMDSSQVAAAALLYADSTVQRMARNRQLCQKVELIDNIMQLYSVVYISNARNCTADMAQFQQFSLFFYSITLRAAVWLTSSAKSKGKNMVQVVLTVHVTVIDLDTFSQL